MKENWNLLEKLGLLVIPKFLDAELCARIVREAETAQAQVAAVGEEARVDLDQRRTKVMDLRAETRAEIAAKLEALQPVLADHMKQELSAFEPFQLLRYQEGDFFKPHQDTYRKGESLIDRRIATTVIFVSAPGEAYEGGSLVMYGLFDNPLLARTGVPVSAEPGMLVAFPSELMHEVTPVERGERYTITAWYH